VSVDSERAQDLHRQVRSKPALTVVTGGQTGVDTMAATAALRVGLNVHIVFPQGFRQEDGELSPDRRRQFDGAVLHELSSNRFEDRTWTCAYLADAVLLLDPAGGAGCQVTALAARELARPLWSHERGPVDPDALRPWVEKVRPRVLMIAGCRASILASSGADREIPAATEAIMTTVRAYADRILG
jgi:hypothetical protein